MYYPELLGASLNLPVKNCSLEFSINMPLELFVSLFRIFVHIVFCIVSHKQLEKRYFLFLLPNSFMFYFCIKMSAKNYNYFIIINHDEIQKKKKKKKKKITTVCFLFLLCGLSIFKKTTTKNKVKLYIF